MEFHKKPVAENHHVCALSEEKKIIQTFGQPDPIICAKFSQDSCSEHSNIAVSRNRKTRAAAPDLETLT
jgi:hypothetical protein